MEAIMDMTDEQFGMFMILRNERIRKQNTGSHEPARMNADEFLASLGDDAEKYRG